VFVDLTKDSFGVAHVEASTTVLFDEASVKCLGSIRNVVADVLPYVKK